MKGYVLLGFPTTEKNIRKAAFVGGREGIYARGRERVCVGDEIQEQECLSGNSDDLSTFLQLFCDCFPSHPHHTFV